MTCRSSGKSNRSSREAASQREQERSSPSGQSDQTSSEMGLFEPHSRRRTSGRRFCSPSACKIRQQQQQQQQQQTSNSVIVAERNPPPSDEQVIKNYCLQPIFVVKIEKKINFYLFFKKLRCWEYMLEKNTSMLFGKYIYL